MKQKDPDDSGGEITSLTLSEEEINEPSEDYTPEGFDSVEEYLSDMRETYELDIQYDDDNRVAAVEDKKFVAGEQWDPVVLSQRTGLPCLVINTVPQFVAQLVGDWRTNRNAVKVIPAENGDKDVADVRSDLIRAIETKARASRVYDNAFESMVQCGDGAFRVAVQYTTEEVFDQEITVSAIDDALSVVWDRTSIDPTGRDASHCFVDDSIPTKEFKERWPDADPSELNTKLKRTLSVNGWVDSGMVKVTEHWRLIERKKLLVMFEDGAVYPFEEGTAADKLNEYLAKHGKIIKQRLAPCRYAQMHLVTGYKILAGPYEWKMNRLPIIRMSGRVVNISDRRVRYGMVRFMKDAARLRNFWRSVAAEQLGYAPKAQWLATDAAVDGREEVFRKAHLSRDPLLVYNEGTEAPERIMPPPMQMALLNEAQVNTQDMKDVTGIHDASLGIKSNETSGRAIMARQREGDIASLTYYDNGNASILEAGDVINQLIGQIYDGTRIIRIIGEDESVKLQKINDPNDPKSPNLAVGMYDVAITTGASYTTRRVEAAEAMMDAVQVFPEMMQIAGDLVAKAQDWPGAEELADRLRKTIPPNLLSDKEKADMGTQDNTQQLMQQGTQMQEALQKGAQELQKLQQENLILKTKHDTETKKLQIDEYNAETARLVAYGNFAKANKEFELQQLEHQAKVELEQQDMDNEVVADHLDRSQTQDQNNTQNDLQQQAQDTNAEAAQASSSSEPSTQAPE